MIVLVTMASRKNLATKIAMKVANLVTGVQLSRAKLFPRNSQDFASCVFGLLVFMVFLS